MKPTKIIIAFAISLMIGISCKKENTTNNGNTNGGNYKRIPIQPPAGFTFPREYTFTTSVKDFEVYANGTKLTNHNRTIESFFARDLFDLDDLQKIILKDKSVISFVSKDNTSDDAKYYFTKDSLIIIAHDEEFSIAKGNFYGFYINNALVYYSYRPASGGGSQKSWFDMAETANLNYALAKAELNNISDLKATDTLAFANIVNDFK
ncbi:MAG: hypothetical protein ACK4K9_03750 [Bacteroidia bacterium]